MGHLKVIRTKGLVWRVIGCPCEMCASKRSINLAWPREVLYEFQVTQIYNSGFH